MRILLVLSIVTVALAASVLNKEDQFVGPLTNEFDIDVLDLEEIRDNDIDLLASFEDAALPASPLFVSWQFRRYIRILQKEMSCGWASLGMPPLAPFKLRQAEYNLHNKFFKTFNKVAFFRIDGLDNFKIKKFNLNLITKKLRYDFLFRNITVSAKNFATDTVLNLMQQYGLYFKLKNNGSLGLNLKNFGIGGSVSYKGPVFSGSINIQTLKAEKIDLESCRSQFLGSLDRASTNKSINHHVGKFIELGIKGNTQLISDLIEKSLVPKLNEALKGNDIVDIISYILSRVEAFKGDTNCVPPADPWA